MKQSLITALALGFFTGCANPKGNCETTYPKRMINSTINDNRKCSGDTEATPKTDVRTDTKAEIPLPP